MQDRNILIVEDDIDMRRLIAQYLERAGFDVREVGNAQEMRLALADGPVDLPVSYTHLTLPTTPYV